jgi:aspartate 1-decarboxylase
MSTVKVSFKGSVDLAQMFIDDVHILTGEGSGTRELAEGDHALTYFIRGQPGSTYTLAISEPASVAYSRTATIDGSTKDANVHWFTLAKGGK